MFKAKSPAVPPLTLVLVVAATCGCGGQPAGLRVGAGSGGAAVKDLRPVFGSPLLLGHSPYVLVPFAAEVPEEGKANWDLSGFSSFSYSSGSASLVNFGAYADPGRDLDSGRIRWNNVVFYNKDTGESRLLLDGPAVICRFYRPAMIPPGAGERSGEGGRARDVSSEYLIFGIADADTNRDGYINADDAVILFHSDLAGRALTRLTPPGTQAVTLRRDGDDRGGDGDLYVLARRDSDGDREFTDRDAAVVLRVNPNRPAEGRPILPGEIMRRAMRIVTE